jgi:hypothetical protein
MRLIVPAPMLTRLRRIYLRIGIHTAPPGTLFYFLHSRARALLHRRVYRFASGELYARGRFGGTPYYDIARVRRTRQVDGLALIFFMGLGDYLFTTPVVEALRVAHPGLLIYAYFSAGADAVNSPLVADMLRSNRHIDAVFPYRGRPGRYWIDYDFSECLKDIPKNFIILPVIYSTDPAVYHRVTSLLETFNLPVRLPVPPPVVEVNGLSTAASRILADIRERAEWNSSRTIVVCHFGTRSSNYLYPHRDKLVSLLLSSGVLVVTFSPGDLTDPGLATVDVREISMNDTIELVRALQTGDQTVHALTVNSVMWPVSAALGIRNLGLHIFFDESVHQYLYPNIFIVTQHLYPRVSPGRVFLASDGDHEERNSDNGTTMTDFNPEFVFRCFEKMTADRIP